MTREPLLVADAGPIIVLAAIGRFELLHAVADEVVVPRSVVAELRAGSPRPGAAEIGAPWIQVVDARADLTEAFALVVDRGEAEALAYAKEHPACLLVVDDQRARRIAEQVGLRFTGTLGILDRAKRLGVGISLRTELAKLRDAGFRISDALVTEFLRRAGD